MRQRIIIFINTTQQLRDNLCYCMLGCLTFAWPMTTEEVPSDMIIATDSCRYLSSRAEDQARRDESYRTCGRKKKKGPRLYVAATRPPLLLYHAVDIRETLRTWRLERNPPAALFLLRLLIVKETTNK